MDMTDYEVKVIDPARYGKTVIQNIIFSSLEEALESYKHLKDEPYHRGHIFLPPQEVYPRETYWRVTLGHDEIHDEYNIQLDEPTDEESGVEIDTEELPNFDTFYATAPKYPETWGSNGQYVVIKTRDDWHILVLFREDVPHRIPFTPINIGDFDMPTEDMRLVHVVVYDTKIRLPLIKED